MAEIGRLTRRAATPWLTPVTLLRAVIVLAVLVIWQLMAVSGLFYRDVVPSLADRSAPRLVKLLSQRATFTGTSGSPRRKSPSAW